MPNIFDKLNIYARATLSINMLKIMHIRELGPIISARREAIGLTQQQLADFSSLSRATISELERGSIVELGITKLDEIFSVLGLSLNAGEQKLRKNGLRMAAVTASVSYKEPMSAAMLKKAMVSGTYPPGLLPHIATLLDEAPLPVLVLAVKEAAEQSGVAPKQIWRHLKHWAEDLKSPRPVWQ